MRYAWKAGQYNGTVQPDIFKYNLGVELVANSKLLTSNARQRF